MANTTPPPASASTNALLGCDPNTTYGSVLQVANNNTGLSGTLETVYDGAGNASPLQLSTAAVNITALQYNGYTISTTGNLSFGGAVTTTSTVSITGAFSTANSVTFQGNNPCTFTVSGTTSLSLPALTDTLVSRTSTDTLTNKTLTTPIIASISNTGTLTLPTSTDTLVGRNTTDTLTNKTLTSPTVTGGTFSSPTLTTPSLGVATVTSLNGVVIPSAFDLPIQRVSSLVYGVATGTTLVSFNNSARTKTDGDQYMSLAITPKNSSNILVIEGIGNFSSSAVGNWTLLLCQDSTTNALGTVRSNSSIVGALYPIPFKFIVTAGTTSSTTFKIRLGLDQSGTNTFNGSGGAGLDNGLLTSYIMITEYAS